VNKSIAISAVLVLSGCASAADPPAAAPAPLDVLRAGGTFGFALEESDPSRGAHAQCATDHPGDAAGESACYAAISAQAAREAIRFSVDGQGRLVWTSFGIEDGKEVTYMEAPLIARNESSHVVAVNMADVPHGMQIKTPPATPPTETLRFEVVDANTVVMVDPRKGKLVFHRRS
jgi:hypothetical protein